MTLVGGSTIATLVLTPNLNGDNSQQVVVITTLATPAAARL